MNKYGYGMTSDGTYLYVAGLTIVPRQGLPGDGTTIGADHQIALLVYDGEGNLLADSVWGGTQGEAVHGLWIDGEYVYLAGRRAPSGRA